MENANIIPVAEYNNTCSGAGMQFEGANGPYKRGFVVVLREGTKSYHKTMAEAEKEATSPVPVVAQEWFNSDRY